MTTSAAKIEFRQRFRELTHADRYAKHPGLRGDALHQAVLRDMLAGGAASVVWLEKAGCFVAGTLIKTDQGDVPIEQIKVGDRVWSKPENGQGEPAYKRVVNTMVREGQEIVAVKINVSEAGRGFVIFCTPEHPIWVVNKRLSGEEDWDETGFVGYKDATYYTGWLPARRLEELDAIQMADGGKRTIEGSFPVYRMDDPNLGWVQYSDYRPDDGWMGRIFDISKPQQWFLQQWVTYPGEPFWEDTAFWDMDDYDQEDRGPRFKATVYNVEVEDFHTYYANGVWVHNACLG